MPLCLCRGVGLYETLEGQGEDIQEMLSVGNDAVRPVSCCVYSRKVCGMGASRMHARGSKGMRDRERTQ